MESNYRVVITKLDKPTTFIDKREWFSRPSEVMLAELTKNQNAASTLLMRGWVITDETFYKFERYKNGMWGDS